jgi:hypothetical protein
MKYMLLIHQGDTPTPRTDARERLSEEAPGTMRRRHRRAGRRPSRASLG